MLSHSQFKFNFVIQIDDASLDEVNLFRKVLNNEIRHLKKKQEKYGKPGESTNTIDILTEISDQAWEQMCRAREARKAGNEDG